MHKEIMTLSNLITIVVPCRNEETYIPHLLAALRTQNIGATRIIIADCSTDRTRQVIADHSRGLNLEIIDGGPVSVAKNRGAKLATTPYILFIDADVRFFDPDVIQDCVRQMVNDELDLIGLNIKCYDSDPRAAVGFWAFNTVNGILKHFAPFAVGAFMLTRRDRFEQFGGFPEQFSTSEDYFLSRRYSVDRFRIVNHYFGQDSRRFKKMGYFGMAAYLIRNFVNRNNKQYWENLDNSRYWD